MKRLAGLGVVMLVGSALTGCGSKALQLAPPPEITPLQQRVAPAVEDLTFTAVLPHEPVTRDDLDVTYRDDFRVSTDATVVISVPVEEQQREKQTKGRNGSRSDDLLDDDGITSFQTAGYFNKAEQQIEKELIRKKFIVLDRSKFEAKLRELRTKTESPRVSASDRALTRLWEEQLKNGEINEEEFRTKMRDLELQREVANREGSRKGEKELVDISELIRAAQSGETRADYILQVNRFYVDTTSDEIVDLLDLEEVQAIAKDNPGFTRALKDAGKDSVRKPGFYGVLNAKLIDVQSGAIVWVGALKVDVQNALKEGLRIQVPATKKVYNDAAINKAIDGYNRDLEDRTAECEKKLLDAEEARRNKGLIGGGDEVSRRVSEYKACVSSLETALKKGPPASAKDPWQYEYLFDDLRVKPVLPSEEDMERLRERWQGAKDKRERDDIRRQARKYQDVMENYYSTLSKLVAAELISTIPAE